MGNWLTGPWWGKFIGGLLGLAIKGPLGAAIGVLVGHQFDLGLHDRASKTAGQAHRTISHAQKQLFFYTTFAVMGHIAKSDGRVSEQEIEAASLVMKSWDLNEQQIELAIKHFNEGKRADFPLAIVLGSFRQAVAAHRPTLLTFVTAQMRVMMADHQIHPATRQRTWDVCRVLGVSRVEMASIEASLRGRQSAGTTTSLAGAYLQLGLTDQVSDLEVKTAYRRMMNRYHPDKLIADTVTPDDRQDAKVELEQCRNAYETIKAARGMR